MHRLPRFLALILILGLSVSLTGQNPHGEDFRINCADCHNAGSWQVAINAIKFDHSSTGFALEGQHSTVACMDCHQDLDFKTVESECVTCHEDVHQMSVGNDCMRCHDSQSWLVFEIPELHEQNGFPLQGAHTALACVDCHDNSNNLVWERLGQECMDCHQRDFLQTTNPNHVEAGFSMNCVACHEPFSQAWSGDNFHYFFPLTQGHDGLDCRDCHQSDAYDQLSPNCVSCHLEDYQNTQNPNHLASGIPRDCALCHSTAPGWMPANFRSHDDLYFPIYSGNHQGEWNSCMECHLDPNNYSNFSCIDCHEHNDEADMRDEHDGVGGYRFESNACLSCHPDGSE